MQCEEFLTLLDDWKDGTLAPEKQHEMDAHARSCPRCQSLVQMQKDLASLAMQEEMPARFSESWRAAIRAEKHSRIRRWQNAASAAAVLVMTAGGVLITGNALIPKGQPSLSAGGTDPAVTLMRAMPAPEPSLWEKTLSFLGSAWPGLILLLAAFLGIVFIIKRRKH